MDLENSPKYSEDRHLRVSTVKGKSTVTPKQAYVALRGPGG
jgi:hypothetical protein